MRCLNIDWLEIYCLEPPERPRNADYFREHGWWVVQRAYGTRIYAEMFTLMDNDGLPFMEVRRSPMSSDKADGIMPFNACHLRVVNRYCYNKQVIDFVRIFLTDNDYLFQRISRIDLCLDFEKFDSGDDPYKFLRRYMQGKYAKINQSLIHAHGKDVWCGRDWQSLSWGKTGSPVSTKLYNKTKELQEVKDKPYIRQAWFEAGLVDDPQHLTKTKKNGTTYSPQIWRVEFSVHSPVKNWVAIEANGNAKKYLSLRNDLDAYDTDAKRFTMFASLAAHYFHFKYYEDGVTKYKCRDKELFKFAENEVFYKVEHPSSDCQQSTLEKRLQSLLGQYYEVKTDPAVRQSINHILSVLSEDDLRRLCENPHSNAQLKALQLAIAQRLSLVTPNEHTDVTKTIQQLTQYILDFKPWT